MYRYWTLPMVFMAVLAAGVAVPDAVPDAVGVAAPALGVRLQAHRGGLEEVPENTLAAFRHAWGIEGAIPETDLRTTKDHVVICLHDATLARTTNAPSPVNETPVSELAFDEVRKWDAGLKFDPRFTGEKVPTLAEVLDLMRQDPARELYLEIKDVDLDALKAALDTYGVTRRVIFVHGDPATCAELGQRFSGARTMTWLSGGPAQIRSRFDVLAASGFQGLSQLQLHLPVAQTRPGIAYALDAEYLRHAMEETRAAGVDLQLRPFRFDARSLRGLLDLGVRWYVADAPQAFIEAVRAAREMPK